MSHYNVIAETNHFIVLDQYHPALQLNEGYQSEDALERELIADLQNQGYEFLPQLNSPEKLLVNLRRQLERLNEIQFTNQEWQRFQTEYLDVASETVVERTRKLHDNWIHDFRFDDGLIKNVSLVDKKLISRNKLQVIQQFSQTGSHANRYDVTLLVNGLPLVQIELKKRGIAIREAFHQVQRYGRESFNSEHSLFKYLQLFVISNGTDTRYFANTTQRTKNSFDFTMNWAKSDNTLIRDLKDFTATFLQTRTLLKVLLKYAVFDVSNTLLIMRPYQIAATERIMHKIHTAYEHKQWSTLESGGFIWHTTGSGKTLTSFKAARLATELEFIDKVLFVVDRKDLDFQTMKEYQRFSPDSVNGSNSTAGLKRNLEKTDNKIIVTTIQKLNHLMRSEAALPIYQQQVVFIFDECHRSQFGEAQKNLKKKFKKYYQFGFTGTPIFSENALGDETTADVFGRELHAYTITDAIRDEKVLKFKVDYHNVRPKFKSFEQEQDEQKLSAAENKQALLHPERIREVSQYILTHFPHKTHRLNAANKGFNAMFAVSSVDAAKSYYECLNRLQQGCEKRLRITTIFSYAANEEQKSSAGELLDESLDVSAMDQSAKDFLNQVIQDYNQAFSSNFSIHGTGFQDYYRDLANRVKTQEVDLLIVVGMFLTGFDAPQLNTLFVDKNLRYHGLIQAYSRTNRIYNATKTFGNIVTFRDLEEATVAAITLFGDKNTRNVVLEKSYEEYLNGFVHADSGELQRGYLEVVQELQQRFPEPAQIFSEQGKKDFTKLFGEYLRLENVLQNFDEFVCLKALQKLDVDDTQAVEAFKAQHHVDDAELQSMQSIEVPSERMVQDYRSTYNDIREWQRGQKAGQEQAESTLDWGDVVFEVDLLKSQEIDLDYILELIFEKNRDCADKATLIDEIRHVIRASVGSRMKEELVVEFIQQASLDELQDRAGLMADFYRYAQQVQKREMQALIESENLNAETTARYLQRSLRQQYASDNGTELNSILPKMSPLNPLFLAKKQTVHQKVVAFVEKFKEVGGSLVD